jgi:hypothetical protein
MTIVYISFNMAAALLLPPFNSTCRQLSNEFIVHFA